MKAYQKAYKKANKERFKAYNVKRKEKQRLYMKTYYIKNKLQLADKAKEYYKKNADKKKIYARKQGPVYRAANKAKQVAKTAKYRAIKALRTLPWLTKEHWVEIEMFYQIAKDLQWLNDPTDPLEVDHIIPLQGKLVSGLHVPWNLQILNKSVNCSKFNKLRKVG